MDNFDDIRPYTDSEIKAAMSQIAKWDMSPQVLKFIYPDMPTDEGIRRLLAISTVHDFQSTFMNDAIRRIIKETTSRFSFSGMSHLRRGQNYLFVSNHRDISLDAFLLQHLLISRYGDTSHIVFGNNLLEVPIMEVLFRSNKLIRMERGGSPRAFYRSLQHLSQYLCHLMFDTHQSVWIAQRNGRAKDGRDLTAPAMLKMLTLGSRLPAFETLEQMHIVPVSVSYEWDPCDAMKATELYLNSQGTYKKAEGEDLRSVATGIIGQKGHVHLALGTPLKMESLRQAKGDALFEQVAAMIDKQIHANYRLMPTNHAAYSLVDGRRKTGHFTRRTLDALKARAMALPQPEMRQLMLEAYAAPVKASLR